MSLWAVTAYLMHICLVLYGVTAGNAGVSAAAVTAFVALNALLITGRGK